MVASKPSTGSADVAWSVEGVREALLAWYGQHRRQLPWRGNAAANASKQDLDQKDGLEEALPKILTSAHATSSTAKLRL
eukprot:4836171-Amphidinium_carterae.1